MNISEQLVERFLTQNGLAFACPQFLLRKDGASQWRAELDFVVLDFTDRKIVFVEVSESGGLGSVEDGVNRCLHEGYLELLVAQLSQETQGTTDGWPAFFLGFLSTNKLVDDAYRKFPDERFFFRPLGDTLGDYWTRRLQGVLPKRPT